MTFTLPYSSQKDWCEKWLKLLKGVVELTDRQRALLVEILSRYLELREKVQDEQVLWTTLLSTAERKKYQATLGMSPYQFTNILTDLRKAQVFTTREGVEQVDPSLLPQPEFHVTFRYQ